MKTLVLILAIILGALGLFFVGLSIYEDSHTYISTYIPKNDEERKLLDEILKEKNKRKWGCLGWILGIICGILCVAVSMYYKTL